MTGALTEGTAESAGGAMSAAAAETTGSFGCVDLYPRTATRLPTTSAPTPTSTTVVFLRRRCAPAVCQLACVSAYPVDTCEPDAAPGADGAPAAA